MLVRTLLAKALYDNLADAPDELSFRRGDIVTVIEQDVDGLVGWWLCLLHGRQGIVPGNRLQVISSVELDQLEKSKVQGGVGRNPTQDFSDGPGVYSDEQGYDVLPIPMKANGQEPPPLTIKDMFSIPYKSPKSVGQETSTIPTVTGSNARTGPPVVSSNSKQNLPAQKQPVSLGKSLSESTQPVYDEIPNRGDVYDEIPGRATEIYDVPNVRKLSTTVSSSIDAPSELYQSPKSNQEAVQRRVDGLSKAPDVQTSNKTQRIWTPMAETLINSLHTNKVIDSATPPSAEVYDTPSRQTGQEQAGLAQRAADPVGSKQVGSVVTGSKQASPDLAGPKRPGKDPAAAKQHGPKQAGTDQVGPKQVAPSASCVGTSHSGLKPSGASQAGSKYASADSIGQKQGGFKPDTSPVSLSNRAGATQSEANKNFLHDFYNKQSSFSASLPHRSTAQVSGQEQAMYVNYRARNVNGSPTLPRASKVVVQNQEVYDVPALNLKGSHGHDEVQEVYDVPAGQSRPVVRDVYAVPHARAVGQAGVAGASAQEIYDIPRQSPPTIEVYDTPSSMLAPKLESSSVPARIVQETYDTPGTSTLKRSLNANVREFQTMKETAIGGPDELYDVPSGHDVNKVMADVTAPHSSHPRAQGNFLLPANMCDADDYVDYHDIWTAEPPKNLVQDVKNMGKSASRSPSPITAQTRAIEPKKSVLDQINFDNVKELPLSVAQALERLGKLHLAVDTCVQTLLNFRFDGWLDVSSLALNIGAIRDFSGKLKTALRLMTEFGLGTLVNSTKHPEGEKLMDLLIEEVEPLLECYYKVKICLMHLDSTDWVIPSSRNSGNEKFFATLNAIMILSQLIPDKCSSFNLYVQKNVGDLFDDSASRDTERSSGSVSVENNSRGRKISARGDSPERKVPPGDAKGKLKPIDARQMREFLEIDNRKSKGLPNNFATEKHPDAEMSAATLRRELAGRRQQARDSAAMGTLRPGPRVPAKPTLPSHRRSLAGVLDPDDAMVVASAVPMDRLVTEFAPDGAKKKYASDPTRPLAGKEGNRPMLSGSCPTLLEQNSAVSNQGVPSIAYAVGRSASQEQIQLKENFPMSDGNTLGKNFPSDSNLLQPSSPGTLHQRSVSLPFGDRANVFAYDQVARQRTDSRGSALDRRDVEALEFFCRQVESQAMTLREAMRNLTESVESREEPEVFVSHSKFVILTAHKVVHAGQEVAERLVSLDVKAKIKDGTGHLTSCIRAVVSATKAAALEYPDASALMEMVSSVLAIGDGVRIVHSECRRALDS